MLSEFALSPAIFRAASYEDDSSVVADLCLRALGPPFLDDCIVRNLHDGDWLRQILNCRDSLHPKAKELLKKLDKQKRLVSHNSIDVICPEGDEEWEKEALASHDQTPLTGMIFSRDSKTNRHRNNPLVDCPEKLANAGFWKDRPCSRRIPRNIEEYSSLLEPVLRHANFIAFIDPHLDPKRPGYQNFIKILTHASLVGRKIKPIIQVHRVAWLGDGKNKLPKYDEIKEIFSKSWTDELEHQSIKLELFLWDDFHDRFVASDLLSMTWSNGFDTTTDCRDRVTVSRLARKDQDDLQEEFQENTTCHNRPKRFQIGASSASPLGNDI